ncbi:MAG: prepilin-type N-terminal cleavage/methylation domain-containing protein [Desulfosudaceae bacterium]
MIRNRRQEASGFTLIEIMVALVLLAIVFMAVFRLFSQTITTDAATRFYTVAPLLAQKVMAETTAGPSNGRYDSSGQFDHYPDYDWQATITEVNADVFDSSGGDIQRVDVTVSKGGGQKFKLRRYVLSGQP